MIGLLIGFIVGLFMGFGFNFGFELVAFLGLSGAAVAVAATIIYRGVQIAGFKRIGTKAIGWAVAGVVVGPLLYWWNWSNNLFACTLASVVLLALFAAVNEALRIGGTA